MCKILLTAAAALFLIVLHAAQATTVQRLAFEQLTDTSELIASGQITQTWAAWDSEHKFIWTHYQLAVSETVKGLSTASLEFAEPGGAVGTQTMSVAGTVGYTVGDHVVVFLARMPNGYLRTTGWAQGRYSLDAASRLHGSPSAGVDTVDVNGTRSGLSLRTLDGMSFSEFKVRVAARVRAR